jgi:hypothetical protein
VLGEEAEDAGRVEGAVAAEEGRGGGDAEPAPADGGGADEVGGEGEAQDDLAEEVVLPSSWVCEWVWRIGRDGMHRRGINGSM